MCYISRTKRTAWLPPLLFPPWGFLGYPSQLVKLFIHQDPNEALKPKLSCVSWGALLSSKRCFHVHYLLCSPQLYEARKGVILMSISNGNGSWALLRDLLQFVYGRRLIKIWIRWLLMQYSFQHIELSSQAQMCIVAFCAFQKYGLLSLPETLRWSWVSWRKC